MTGPMRFFEGRNGEQGKDRAWQHPHSRSGRGRGLMQLYILHSLRQEPKSGYDLLKEISEKTKGAWVPSKGTLYPMLAKMAEEGLIEVSETGLRSKSVYALTEKGRQTLESIVSEKREEREKMFVFRNILFEIFHDESDSFHSDLMKIRHLAEKIADEKQSEAKVIVKQCLEDLQRLESDEDRSS
jgi:DNA-binding PadR family transcriptional regulator